MERKKKADLARFAATRVVGLAALGGFAALGLGTFGTRAAAGDVTQTSGNVASSVMFDIELQARVTPQNTVQLIAQGQMDFVHHALQAMVTLPNPGPVPTANPGPHATGTPTTPPPPAGPMQLRAEWVNDHAYVTIPPSLTAMAGGAHECSLSGSPAMSQKVDVALSQSAVALTYAKILLNALTEQQTVHHLKPRTIDGVAETGVQADLTMAQLLKLVPELSPAMTSGPRTPVEGSIPLTVWVDQEGRLVEVTVGGTKGGESTITGSMRFSHYNAPVSVIAPAPGTFQPLPPNLQLMFGGVNIFGGSP